MKTSSMLHFAAVPAALKTSVTFSVPVPAADGFGTFMIADGAQAVLDPP